MATLTSAVRCPYCQHRQALSSQTYQELRAYGAEMERRLGMANQELQRADAWARWHGSGRTPGKSLAVALGLMMGVPMLLAGGAYVAHALGLFESGGGPVLSFVIMGASYGGVVIYLVWYYASRRGGASRRTQVGVSRVACPNCGAPNEMRAGKTVETCGHCGAALTPTKTVMMEGLTAAQQHIRRSSLERYRAERKGMAQVLGTSAANFLPFIIIGSFFPMIVLTTIVFSWQMFVTGEEPFDPLIFVFWAMSAALVGGLIGFVMYRRAKKAAWRQGLGDIARQFHGNVTNDLTQMVGWLNRYWAAPYPILWLWKGVYFGAASLDVHGYPTLVDVEPHGYQNSYPARVHVVLAAWVPGLSEGGSPPPLQGRALELRDWLSRSGFDVEPTPGGLLARARPEVISRLRSDPSRAHELAPIIASLAEIAEQIGARPVQPMEL